MGIAASKRAYHPPDDAGRPLRPRLRPFGRGSAMGAFGHNQPLVGGAQFPL